ncbi:MAG: AAA family ATPase [Actinomycetota bacterium]
MTLAPVRLIGGAPGAGKTTLGRALGAYLDVPSLTGDDIVTGILGVTTEQSHPDLHMIGKRGHIEYFTSSDPEDLRSDALAQHAATWHALEFVARKRSRIGQPIVIDHWSLDPKRVAESRAGDLRPVWLHIDPEVLDARERDLAEFAADSSDPERMHTNFMSRSLWWNEHVRRSAHDLGLPAIHQDGSKSVDDLVNEALIATSKPLVN